MCGECFEKEKCPLGHYSGRNRGWMQYFPSKWRLQVHNLDFKCCSSTFSVEWLFLVNFLFISVYPDSSIDVWTLILGPKTTNISIFGQNEGTRSIIWIVNTFDRLNSWIVSLLNILLISAHLATSIYRWTLFLGSKWRKISIFDQNEGWMSLLWIGNAFDRPSW